jgi:hypothetical protein
MSRVQTGWPLILVALACATGGAACTLLSDVDDLRVVPAEQPASIPASPSTPTPTGEDGSTSVPSGDAGHVVAPPFDAAAFPPLDAAGIDAAGGDGGTTSNTFFDDFARDDGSVLGNGWIERQPNAFRLTNGSVVKNDTFTSYRDNITYRPSSEDVLDVEVTMELKVTAIPASGNPQLWARVRNVGVNVVDGYHIYLDDGQVHFHLARHLGAMSNEIAFFDTQNALATVGTYRLLLRVTGTSPVLVYSRLEARQQNYTWQTIGETGYTDNAPGRIKTAGAVGFSGDRDALFTFDNFSRVGF